MGVLDMLRAFSSVRLPPGPEKYVDRREFMEAQARLEASIASILAVLRDGSTGPGDALSVLGNADDAEADRADIAGTANQVLRVNSAGDALAFGQVNLASSAAITGTLPVGNGGTGLASYTAGDLLYATAATTLAKLAKGTAYQALMMNSGATAPEWAHPVRGFFARRVANAQTFTNNAWTTGTYDTEDVDQESAFVHTTGIYTAQRAGWHVFAGRLTSGGIDDAERCISSIHLNGSLYLQGWTQFSSTTDQDIGNGGIWPVYLAANDTIDFRINHNEGADTTQALGTGFNWFAGIRIG